MRCFELIEVFCIGYFPDFVLGWFVCLKKQTKQETQKTKDVCFHHCLGQGRRLDSFCMCAIECN